MSGGFGQFGAKQAMDSAHSAQHEAQRTQSQVEALRSDVERLLMITEALWMLLKEQHGYTDDVLTSLITQIDLRDGQLDGKAGKTPVEHCPHCGRPLAKHRPACLYCGKPVQQNPFAR